MIFVANPAAAHAARRAKFRGAFIDGFAGAVMLQCGKLFQRLPKFSISGQFQTNL
jgi:hypothetical protein